MSIRAAFEILIRHVRPSWALGLVDEGCLRSRSSKSDAEAELARKYPDAEDRNGAFVLPVLEHVGKDWTADEMVAISAAEFDVIAAAVAELERPIPSSPTFQFCTGDEVNVTKILAIDAHAPAATLHMMLGHGSYLRVQFRDDAQRSEQLATLRAFRSDFRSAAVSR